jgi:hypothetical protein
MQSPRDKIGAALFTLLETMNGTGTNQYDFGYFSRNFKEYDALGATDFPAFCMVYLGEIQHQEQAWGLRTYVMEFLLQFCFKTDPGTSRKGEEIGMAILDALDAFFPPSPAQPQTLGGLCVEAWVDGAVQLDTGVVMQPMVLKVPVKILCGN